MRVCVYVCVKMMDEIGIAVTVRLFDDGHNFSPTVCIYVCSSTKVGEHEVGGRRNVTDGACK